MTSTVMKASLPGKFGSLSLPVSLFYSVLKLSSNIQIKGRAVCCIHSGLF